LVKLNTEVEKGSTSVTIGLGQVVIDSQRADEIAAFWSALLERPITGGANQFYAVIPASEDGTFPALMFLAVPEPRHGKNRLHLDLVATDLPAEVERAVALGATKVAEFDEYGTIWTTLTDPEGNVFDIGLSHSEEPAS
jgi:predicted enzyme related to lactoylglutathione lyase